MQPLILACHLSASWLWPTDSQINCKTGSLVQVDSDTVLAAWYGGSAHIPNVHDSEETNLWIGRLKQGVWSKPECIFQEKGYHVWNPVFLKTATKLYLFFRKFQAKVAEPSPVRTNREFHYCYMVSDTNGTSWSLPQELPDSITGPTKALPHILEDGSWVIPSSKNDACFIERSFDDGTTFTRLGPFVREDGSSSLTEPCLVRKKDQTFTVFFRNREMNPANRFVMTASFDPKTQTSSPVTATTIPNPDSGIDCCRLRDGRWLLAVNPSFEKRSPLSLYASDDEGKTWKEVLKVEEGTEAYSQPAVLQAEDGMVHLMYAAWEASGRKNIKHIYVDPTKLSP